MWVKCTDGVANSVDPDQTQKILSEVHLNTCICSRRKKTDNIFRTRKIVAGLGSTYRLVLYQFLEILSIICARKLNFCHKRTLKIGRTAVPYESFVHHSQQMSSALSSSYSL